MKKFKHLYGEKLSGGMQKEFKIIAQRTENRAPTMFMFSRFQFADFMLRMFRTPFNQDFLSVHIYRILRNGKLEDYGTELRPTFS